MLFTLKSMELKRAMIINLLFCSVHKAKSQNFNISEVAHPCGYSWSGKQDVGKTCISAYNLNISSLEAFMFKDLGEPLKIGVRTNFSTFVLCFLFLRSDVISSLAI